MWHLGTRFSEDDLFQLGSLKKAPSLIFYWLYLIESDPLILI